MVVCKSTKWCTSWLASFIIHLARLYGRVSMANRGFKSTTNSGALPCRNCVAIFLATSSEYQEFLGLGFVNQFLAVCIYLRIICWQFLFSRKRALLVWRVYIYIYMCVCVSKINHDLMGLNPFIYFNAWYAELPIENPTLYGDSMI